MLISIDTGKKVTQMPAKRANDYRRWRSRLSDADYEKVVGAINAAIGDGEVCTAGWLPGHDWTGTPYEALYHACKQNRVQSGMFFGLIVFEVLMRRTDRTWGFTRYEEDRSMTYFVVTAP